MTHLDELLLQHQLLMEDINTHKSTNCTGSECDLCHAYDKVLEDWGEEIRMEVDSLGGDTFESYQ